MKKRHKNPNGTPIDQSYMSLIFKKIKKTYSYELDQI